MSKFCLPLSIKPNHSSTSFAEKLPICLHSWVWLHIDRDMGSCFNVRVKRFPMCKLTSADKHTDRLLSSGLSDGGTAGLIWGFLIVSTGFLLVFSSLAEMASM